MMIEISKLDQYIENENADADLYFEEVPPEEVKALVLKLGSVEAELADANSELEDAARTIAKTERLFKEQYDRAKAAETRLETVRKIARDAQEPDPRGDESHAVGMARSDLAEEILDALNQGHFDRDVENHLPKGDRFYGTDDDFEHEDWCALKIGDPAAGKSCDCGLAERVSEGNGP